MHKSRPSAVNFRFPAARSIVIAGVVFLAGCQDITAPEEATSTIPNSPSLAKASAAVFADLGASLEDMTGWSLAALDSPTQRQSLVGILNGLKGHLISGNVSLIQKDVTDARGYIASLPIAQQAEIGPVGLAVDLIQKTIDQQ